MSNSTRLLLPYIEPAQAQKHITHYEALARLDALIHLSVLSDSHTQPPADPIEGDRYLVPDDGAADWEDKIGQIAYFDTASWQYLEASIGWLCFIQSANKLKVRQISSWEDLSVTDLGAAQLDGFNTFTAGQTIAAGDGISGETFLSLMPTDRSAGKPDLYFKKSITAASWQIGLWDEVDNAGQIGFFSTSLAHNGAELYSSANAGPLVQDVKITTFSTNSVWQPHAKCIAAMIDICGGGGGGGFRGAAGQLGCGASGGSGAVARRLLPRGAIPNSAQITIGLPGAGGAAGNLDLTGTVGSEGGESRYSDPYNEVTAPGGHGGGHGYDSTVVTVDGGAAAAWASGGNENYPGHAGQSAVGSRSTATSDVFSWFAGAGGMSALALGHGAPAMMRATGAQALSQNGDVGLGAGGGGGGGVALNGGSAQGGGGGPGFCRITEWVGN